MLFILYIKLFGFRGYLNFCPDILVINIFWYFSTFSTVDPKTCLILFLEMGVGVVSPPHFVYVFSRKIFLMLFPINWSSFIALLPLLFEMLCNMCIVIIFFPVYYVINFESNLTSLIKPFYHMKKKLGEKSKDSRICFRH